MKKWIPFLFLFFAGAVRADQQVPFAVADPSTSQDLQEIYKQVDDLSSNSGVTGEYKPGLLSSTSAQMVISHGPGFPPLYQWDGRINGPISYSITGTTSTTTTSTLGANTSLTGTFTTLSAAEKVIIQISGTCQAAAADGGSIGLSRGGVNVSGGSAGCTRLSNPLGSAEEESCSCSIPDVPGSVGTFTYTVTMNSTSGGTFQFGETNRASYLTITGYPK